MIKLIEVPEDKFILDPACAGREMWLDKAHPNTIFGDIRTLEKGSIPYRKNFGVAPDLVMDFRKMGFPDKSFKLVVFDPPHLKTLGKNAYYRKKWGGLNPETWQSDLARGFAECWRVLEDYGILVLKWCDYEIPFPKVLRIIKRKPLFYSTLGKKNSNIFWACFMKIPEQGDGA